MERQISENKKTIGKKNTSTYKDKKDEFKGRESDDEGTNNS